jgi:hypothetical protein
VLLLLLLLLPAVWYFPKQLLAMGDPVEADGPKAVPSPGSRHKPGGAGTPPVLLEAPACAHRPAGTHRGRLHNDNIS